MREVDRPADAPEGAGQSIDPDGHDLVLAVIVASADGPLGEARDLGLRLHVGILPAMADSDDLLKRFFGSQKEQVLVHHVVREIQAGRDLADVLADPFVTNRAEPLEMRALLDNAEISHAVGDDAIARIKAAGGPA